MTESAIVGTAVHEAVETILRALKGAGCTSLADTRAIGALRDLGGYTSIAATSVNRVLATLEDNPRMQSQVARLGERLHRRTPEMRRAVQTLLSRMSFVADDVPTTGEMTGSAPAKRARVGPGVHPEVPLTAEDERFAGRVDLLTVRSDHAELLDFKTGLPADDHSDQLRLYGLLWMLDGVANPDQLPVGALTVAYVNRDESVSLPDAWDTLHRSLEERIELADQSLAAPPPKAIPSAECRYCPVRHMCDDYWRSKHAVRDPASHFGDVEVDLLGRNGPRSWSVRFVGTSGEGLLRTASEADEFEAGQRLRVLDVAITETEDDGETVATITAGSEVFALVRW